MSVSKLTSILYKPGTVGWVRPYGAMPVNVVNLIEYVEVVTKLEDEII